MVVEIMDNDKGNGGKVVWNDDHGEVIQWWKRLQLQWNSGSDGGQWKLISILFFMIYFIKFKKFLQFFFYYYIHHILWKYLRLK
jgi:hypothetical protein